MVRCSANWASGWWTARIDCSDEPLIWSRKYIERDGGWKIESKKVRKEREREKGMEGRENRKKGEH